MHRCALRAAKPQTRRRDFRLSGLPLREPQRDRSETPCKAFRIGPDANFRDRSGAVARQGQVCLAWRTAVPQTRAVSIVAAQAVPFGVIFQLSIERSAVS